MIPVFLTKIKTRDGIWLDGIVIEPPHQSKHGTGQAPRKSKTALIWVYGLGSNFSRDQSGTKEFSSLCQRNGIGYFKFNTRGHDVVNRDAPVKKGLQGAGFEKFEECIHDIRAMIVYARKLGYRNIILAGHSTGANKTLYYTYKTHDQAIKGIILLGPISDIVANKKLFGEKGLRERQAITRKLLRKKPDALVPQKYGIWTAKRYASILEPRKPEDVFPYHNPDAKWKELKSVRVPIAIIFGSRDQYLDRPVKTLISIFQKNAHATKSFSGIIIKGADHSFHKKEKELASVTIHWIHGL